MTRRTAAPSPGETQPDGETPPRKTHTGLRRVVLAFGHSMRGFRDAFRNEAAFRQEVAVLFVIVLPGVVLLGQTPLERLLLLGSWLQVMIVELLNSGLETVVDRIGTEHHELSRIAKDMGSAAVLVSLTLAVLTWATVTFADL